ncbi:unnamed protein product [Periconia digitata]|uniref:Uncharacterized protein n=1 Tax=Periconia digitata TaxID=1303443 RepID=A0A9W4XDV7_9PLEO|nr:unnamed protein product [Periconia digitata]
MRVFAYGLTMYNVFSSGLISRSSIIYCSVAKISSSPVRNPVVGDIGARTTLPDHDCVQ